MKTIIISAAGYCCAVGMNAQTPQLRADNIDEIVSAMTLKEKAQLVVGTGMAGCEGGAPVVGSTKSIVPGAAGTTCAIPRLGIPAIVLADGPAGLRIDAHREGDGRTYYCTHFPIGVCLSASWNAPLVRSVGHAIGEEALDYGVDVMLAPATNIHRNPLCGRTYEYYSEDPLLSGLMAAAYINGVQENGVGTSLKHFAMNNQETGRLGNDVRVSRRTAREIYLKPFEIAVKAAQPWTVMSSYNKVNGIYTAESRDLLTTILRDEWGFRGAVMTDWFGGVDRVACMEAGNDLIEPGLQQDIDTIEAAVLSGRLDVKVLDNNVRRILRLIVKTPRFKGYRYDNNPDLKAHAQTTRTAAAEGMVLLKNNGALPLAESVRRVAVFGSTSYDLMAGGTGSGNVNRAYTVSLTEGLENNGYSVDDSLKTRYARHIADEYRRNAPKQNDVLTSYLPVPRPSELPLTDRQIAEAVSSADVALVTIGRQFCEFMDIPVTEFDLHNDERELLKTVCRIAHGVGKPVVVILNVGGAIETASWRDLPDAILCAWQGGQEGGNSIADVLTGRTSPSGKLPMTFPVRVEDHASSRNFPLDAPFIAPTPGASQAGQSRRNIDYTDYEEGIFVGYRYFDTYNCGVAYPFGYGLSYTTFDYGAPVLTDCGDSLRVEVMVTNSGSRAGKEVVQIYVTAPDGDIEKPAQELKAFAKTRLLQPGERETLVMSIAKADLASYHEDGRDWVVDKGEYLFKVGASSRDIRSVARMMID